MGSLETIVESRDEFHFRVAKLGLNSEPYDASPEIVEEVWNLFHGRHSDDYKSRVLLDWCRDNLRYMEEGPYFGAGQTFRSRFGMCVNLAFLYTTMAKVAGLDSCFFLVSTKGKEIDHACSGVYLDDKLVLVDPAYKKFNVKHRECRILNDGEIRECYTEYFLKYNEGNSEAVRIFEEQVIRKKFSLSKGYESGYCYRDPEYDAFLSRKRQESKRQEEPSFFEKLAEDFAYGICKRLLVRTFKLGFASLAISGALNCGDVNISAYSYLIKYPYIYWKDQAEKRDVMELRFNTMVKELKNVYPGDMNPEIEYSEKNYSFICKIYRDYLKPDLPKD